MNAISEIIEQGALITRASRAVIFLHGRGGTAESILSLADRLCTSDDYVVAPQAVNNSWYPHSFMAEDKLNEPYVFASVNEINDLIAKITKHIPKEQIFLVGFSQGACMALEVTSRYAAQYGGVVAFTGGLIGSVLDKKKYQGNFEGTKVFIGNGDQDPYIPLMRCEESKQVMESLGAHVILKVYPGRAHTVSDDEIKFVKENIL